MQVGVAILPLKEKQKRAEKSRKKRKMQAGVAILFRKGIAIAIKANGKMGRVV